MCDGWGDFYCVCVCVSQFLFCFENLSLVGKLILCLLLMNCLCLSAFGWLCLLKVIIGGKFVCVSLCLEWTSYFKKEVSSSAYCQGFVFLSIIGGLCHKGVCHRCISVYLVSVCNLL